MTDWRKLLAGALAGAICLFGLTADVAANPRNARAGDHPKLDRKLNDRSNLGGSGISRTIVVLKPGCDATGDYAKAGGKRGKRLGLINADVVELTNAQLRKLANSPCVKDIHSDRKTGGEMNRAAVVEGARAVQAWYGYSGAGIGVAVVDSGITPWHDDLTYSGSNPNVQVVNGQRVAKFVDFVNGRLTPYDDNGHGTHVAGIIAGNGYDTYGARAGMAPAASLVSLKVLDDHGAGYISNVIAALDWVAANHAAYNIRVVNVSVGAAVTESYTTDPLTLAAKRVVDQGIVVVTAAGNLGRNKVTGKAQYGGITAPGNAPWVLTVGAYSHQGTLTRLDDKMAPYSSRGPTRIDFAAKPDIVATGTGIVSLSDPGGLMYTTKAAYLLNGSRETAYKPYLSLTGTSMASPVVAGAVALMLQANPRLTPNLVKAILQYTAQRYHYDPLTQGAGFLNAKGAVDLARFFRDPQAGQPYPSSRSWSRTILWGNHRVKRGVIKPAGSAWALNVVWGAAADGEGDNIVWGTACDTPECDNIVWGTSAMDADNIVWGTFDQAADNTVWGTADCAPGVECDNIVWGTAAAGTACDTVECDNIVWGTTCGELDCDNIVWGTQCLDAECDNIVWGTAAECAPDVACDNIVWGTTCTAVECDNIVWGTSGEVDNIVWGTSSEADNITWGCSGEETPIFDDPDVPSVFDDTVFDDLFNAPAPVTTVTDPPPATVTETTVVTDSTTTVVGGGF